MQTFFSFACVVALICAIVFGIKLFRRKQKQMLIPFVVAIAACIGAAMIVSPADDTADTPEPSESISASEAPSPSPSVGPSEAVSVAPSPAPSESEEPSPSPVPVSEAPSPTPEPSEEPEETPTPTPSPTPTPAPTPEPSQATTIRGYSSNTIVYVSRSGKIHRVSDCSGMSHYTEMALGEADARPGYEYCDNCW